MPALLIRHKVNDFETWKPVFDELDANRRAHGCQGSWIFRNDDNPSETLILLRWDDLDRARLYVQSDDLRDALNRGGVAEEPDFWFLEDSETTIN
jgi:heme-degrading monooxygenase HmoA